MTVRRFHRLIEQWRNIPDQRRQLMAGAAWLLLALLLWQLAWLPGRSSLQHATQALAKEQALSRQLDQASAAPGYPQARRAALTAALLSEQAQAAGLRIIDMEAQDGRAELLVEGAAQVVLQWLHGQELEGTRMLELQLQRVEDLLQARLGVELGGRD